MIPLSGTFTLNHIAHDINVPVLPALSVAMTYHVYHVSLVTLPDQEVVPVVDHVAYGLPSVS